MVYSWLDVTGAYCSVCCSFYDKEWNLLERKRLPLQDGITGIMISTLDDVVDKVIQDPNRVALLDASRLHKHISIPDLTNYVCDATGIRPKHYLHSEYLPSASITRKMSWASGRYTSRREDTAYCLLGLFNFNMPLLYVEGLVVA